MGRTEPGLVHPDLGVLLRFAVRFVRTAERAELLELEATGSGLLILGVRVIPVLTFRALECDYFSWHVILSSKAIQTTLSRESR